MRIASADWDGPASMQANSKEYLSRDLIRRILMRDLGRLE